MSAIGALLWIVRVLEQPSMKSALSELSRANTDLIQRSLGLYSHRAEGAFRSTAVREVSMISISVTLFARLFESKLKKVRVRDQVKTKFSVVRLNRTFRKI